MTRLGIALRSHFEIDRDAGRRPRLRYERSIDVSHAVRDGPRQAGVTPQATVHTAVLLGAASR